MNFPAVLNELELQPVTTPVTPWLDWARALNLELPTSFLEALNLGAAQLLTQYSNAEKFEVRPELYRWRGSPLLPLLTENQGNFKYGLWMNGQPNPPVLWCNKFQRALGRGVEPVKWQPFSDDFATFAFARLHDFQYLWNAPAQRWDDDWFGEILISKGVQDILSQRFKCGPVTPAVYDGLDEGVRHRYYRLGQRLILDYGSTPVAYGEFSAATEELYHALKAEVGELQENFL